MKFLPGDFVMRSAAGIDGYSRVYNISRESATSYRTLSGYETALIIACPTGRGHEDFVIVLTSKNIIGYIDTALLKKVGVR